MIQYIQGMTPDQRMLFMSEYNSRRKSRGIAYILAILLGQIGAHRFYLNQLAYGICLLLVHLSMFFVLGWGIGSKNLHTLQSAVTVITTCVIVIWCWQLAILWRDVDQVNDNAAAESAAFAQGVVE